MTSTAISAAWLRVLERPRAFVVGHVAALAVAAIFWASALARADLRRLSGYGLLPVLPPEYYLALTLLSAGFALALSARRTREPILAAYVVLFVLVIHATPSILFHEPRYAWTYKHLGVIAFIGLHGAVNRSIDIYQNWPAFFALGAWLEKATGFPALSYARWAQPFFELVDVALLVFVFRAFTGGIRLLWAAVWLSVLGAWVGQDYLAPQAVGFALTLAVIGVCVRCAPEPRPARNRISRALEQRAARFPVLVGMHVPAGRRPLAPWPALLVGGCCYVAAVITHQLSPVMILAMVWIFALVTRRLPLWVPVVMTGIEIYWIGNAWPFVSQHFQLFDPEPAASVPGADPSRGLHGLVLARYGQWALTALLAAAATAGIIRRARHGYLDLVPVALATAPFTLLAVQSYGGEGNLRTYLFAEPWLAFLGAAILAPAAGSRLPPVLRLWKWAAVSSFGLVFLLIAYYGPDKGNYMTRGDVAASAWWEEHAPPRSMLGVVVPNFPTKLTARYAESRISVSSTPSLTGDGRVRYRNIVPGDLHRIVKMLDETGAAHMYIAISPSQVRYAQLYRLLPDGAIARLTRYLSRSRQFRLVYWNGSSRIFEVVRPKSA